MHRPFLFLLLCYDQAKRVRGDTHLTEGDPNECVRVIMGCSIFFWCSQAQPHACMVLLCSNNNLCVPALHDSFHVQLGKDILAPHKHGIHLLKERATLPIYKHWHTHTRSMTFEHPYPSIQPFIHIILVTLLVP